MHAVLHTALLGFFSDFTTSGISFSLLKGISWDLHFQTALRDKKVRDISIENMAYSICSIISLWNIESRRTLLRASQTEIQSLESSPAKIDWKNKTKQIPLDVNNHISNLQIKGYNKFITVMGVHILMGIDVITTQKHNQGKYLQNFISIVNIIQVLRFNIFNFHDSFLWLGFLNY